jgi:ribose-phosphate pyrophosphokinase
MSVVGSGMLVLGFPDYAPQARQFAAAAGAGYADVEVHYFPDGESLVRVPETLPADVVFCRTLNDANRQLVELELAAATALGLGATRLTLVAPYLCYMRQDKAFRAGQAVSQHIIGNWLARRFDALITVDPHLHRTRRLVDAVPVARAVAVSAAPAMADWLARRGGQPLVVGPDEESAQWVTQIAATGNYDCCVAHKQRLGDRDVRITLPRQSFANRDVVLVDDVISTGHTIAAAARMIATEGAASLSVLVSHALFVTGALENLKSAGVGEIVSTDSIPHRSNGLPLAGLLADGLRRVLDTAGASAY